MKRNNWRLATCLIVATVLLASCAKEGTTTAPVTARQRQPDPRPQLRRKRRPWLRRRSTAERWPLCCRKT